MKKLVNFIFLIFTAGIFLNGCTYKTTYNSAFIDGKVASSNKFQNKAAIYMTKSEEANQTTQHFSKFAGSANSITTDIGEITKEIGLEFLFSKFNKVSFDNEQKNADFVIHSNVIEYDFWLDMGLFSSIPTVEFKINFEAYSKNKSMYKKDFSKTLSGNPSVEVSGAAIEINKLLHKGILEAYKAFWNDLERNDKLAFLSTEKHNQYATATHIVSAMDDISSIIASSKQTRLNNKKWLLVIAPESYDKASKVIYSATSGADFAAAIAKLQGVPEQNSYALIGDTATTGAIKDTIAKLADNVKDGDTIYFYYSGHGIPDPASKESFILPKDKAVEYVAKEQELKLSNIYTTLQNSKASKIIAVIDACFSGTTNGQSVYKGVAAAYFKPKSFNANPNGKLAILTAGKDNQFSNSYDEKGHRLFSYFVIKSLLNGRKNVGDIYKDIVLKVKDESRRKGGDTYEQEPQINGNGKLEL